MSTRELKEKKNWSVLDESVPSHINQRPSYDYDVSPGTRSCFYGLIKFYEIVCRLLEARLTIGEVMVDA